MVVYKRLMSILIDYVVIIIVLFLMGTLVAAVSGMLGNSIYGQTEQTCAVYLTLLFSFIYYGHPFKKEAQTIGEKLMKFKVVAKSGNKINLWSALTRTVALAPLLAVCGVLVLDKKPTFPC